MNAQSIHHHFSGNHKVLRFGTMDGPWLRCKDSPFAIHVQPILINTEDVLLFPVKDTEANYIACYNLLQEKFSKWIDLNSTTINYNQFRPGYHGLALDDINQKIFSHLYSSLFEICLKTKSMDVTSTNYECVFGTAHVIDGEYHLIGGGKQNAHVIWNELDIKYDKIHTFNDWLSESFFFNSVFLKSMNRILLFGGTNGTLKAYDHIYSYSIAEKKWVKLTLKLPHLVYHSGCVVTMDERYIIFLGGVSKRDDTLRLHNGILVLNTKNMEFRRSSINCPECREYQAVVIKPNNEGDELIIDGFVRRCVDMDVPKEILCFILKMYGTEIVYIFDQHKCVWKTSISHILRGTNWC